jgi:cell fate (sporulation/competence/biofilm development) regulator YlbF (YheA/YmcA/DUF963 family)
LYKKEDIKKYLKLAGSYNNPSQFGIDRKSFKESILNAMHIRDRYTILKYLSEKNKLEEIANELVKIFY